MWLNAEEKLILVSVWLPWCTPRLHVAWGSSHRWASMHTKQSVISMHTVFKPINWKLWVRGLPIVRLKSLWQTRYMVSLLLTVNNNMLFRFLHDVDWWLEKHTHLCIAIDTPTVLMHAGYHYYICVRICHYTLTDNSHPMFLMYCCT